MEATSFRGRIQVSSTTADELVKMRRKKWLQPREGTIAVTGKGDMQTYWLETKEESIQKAKKVKPSKYNKNGSSTVATMETAPLPERSEHDNRASGYRSDDEGDLFDDDVSDSDELNPSTLTKTERLVEWNVKILSQLLQQILAARRDDAAVDDSSVIDISKVEEEINKANSTVLEEFKEIIMLPSVTTEELQARKRSSRSVELSASVISQLRDLLTLIAGMYHQNDFHNFEHASHVTASVRKLLTRIVNADRATAASTTKNALDRQSNAELVDLTGNSYGITSDPLTQFAVVFSAVIHDADHPGVPK